MAIRGLILSKRHCAESDLDLKLQCQLGRRHFQICKFHPQGGWVVSTLFNAPASAQEVFG